MLNLTSEINNVMYVCLFVSLCASFDTGSVWLSASGLWRAVVCKKCHSFYSCIYLSIYKSIHPLYQETRVETVPNTTAKVLSCVFA